MSEEMSESEEVAWAQVQTLNRILTMNTILLTAHSGKIDKLRAWHSRWGDPARGGDELLAILAEEVEIKDEDLPSAPKEPRGVARMKAHFAECERLGITEENYDERVRETSPWTWPDYLKDKP